MAIYLIRHGETASNANRVVQVPETPLSERGLAQAERLGRRLAEDGISRILSSDYARAHTTAEHVSATTGVPIEIEETLRERNFGDLRGRPYSEVGDLFAEGYEPPGGESWEVFFERADRSWEIVKRAAAETDGHLAVVTHGLICFAYVSRSARTEPGHEVSRGFANTSLTVIESQAPFRVELLDCSAHLDEETAHDRRSVSGL
ncbi:MAG: histidine phosphatase family protein [Deltaproteobacteria bacterium]|nr:histidine phosphatase family protein [Deltaproteobacteria bacterium]MBW2414131.1 histidine phosphatase family protein [Deltaproteobacteria bacterium]